MVYVDVTRGWIPVHTTNSEVEDKTDISVRYLVVAGGGASARTMAEAEELADYVADKMMLTENLMPLVQLAVTVGAGGGGNNDISLMLEILPCWIRFNYDPATRGGFGSTPQNTAQSGGSGGGAGQGGSGTASGNQGGFTPAEGNNGGANQAGSTSSGGAGGGGAGAGQSVCKHWRCFSWRWWRWLTIRYYGTATFYAAAEAVAINWKVLLELADKAAAAMVQ